MLAHLMMAEGRPVPVEVLFDDLWGDVPPRDPAHALHAHVSRLRETLSVQIEFVDGAGYRLATDDAESDVRQFRHRCAQGRAKLAAGDAAGAIVDLEAALGLWRGPALENLRNVMGLRDSAKRLETLRKDAAAERIEAYLRSGQGDAIIGELRAKLDLQPLQEHGWRQLMMALHQTGRDSEAVMAYHRAREQFTESLGIDPPRQLTDLHAAILRGNELGDVVERRRPRPPQHQGATGPQFIGRLAEMATLEQAWHESKSGLRMVTITGEPGVGKTRLAAEFGHRAAKAQGRLLRGHCPRSVTAPYQPFAEILRASLDADMAREARTDPTLRGHVAGLVRVAPECAQICGDESAQPPTAGCETDEHRSAEAVAAWLAVLSAQEPLVLHIDDLQWVDAQSLLLLQHLLRSPQPIKALIIATLRDQDLDAEVAVDDTATHPMNDFLRQSDAVTHLPLGRLNDGETADLLRCEATRLAAVAQLPAGAASYVQTASGGNPLYIVELTRYLITTQGQLPAAVPDVPTGLRRVIEERVKSVDPDVRVLLRQAAVIGSEFDPIVLAQVSGADHRQVDAMTQAASQAQLIEPQPGAELRYTFSHDVVRTVLYESVPPLERAALHARIGAVIEARYANSLDGYHREIAHHHRRSNAPDAAVKAIEHLSLAGQNALARGAPAEAEKLFSDAVELLGTNAEPPVRCDLLIGLGSAQRRRVQPYYRETLLEATQLAMELGDSTRLIAAVLENSRGWWSSTDKIDYDRVAGIEAALASYESDDQAVTSRLLAAWASENVRDPSRREQVLRRSEQALDLADACHDSEALADALSTRFEVLYALFEDPAECLRISEQLADVARQSDDRGVRLSAALCLAQASMMLGNFSLADRHLDEALHLAETLDQPPRLWLARGWHAMRTAMRGRLEAAEELMGATFELGTQIGQADAFTWFTGQLFTVRMLQGRLPEIAELVREHAEYMVEGIPAWRAAMTVALARSEYRHEAEAILEDFAAGSFEQLPRDILWLHAMCYLSMTCDALGRGDIAGDLYRTLLPYRGMLAHNGTIDAGPVDLQLGALAHTMGDHEGAEGHWRAAEVLCRRIDAPLWRKQIQDRRSGSVAS